jgi:dienelactone hydrolase
MLLRLRPAILVLATLLLLITPTPIARAEDYASPGPYPVSWKRVTIPRADRSTFTARLYYPARARGQDAPYNEAGAPYPAIVFGHGYQVNPSYYAGTLEHLASWGYLVCAPESGLELFPSHRKFAEDLSRCLTFLEQENEGERSWLRGQVDTAHFGAAGHSMGAGAAILAASADRRIRAVAALSAAETNPPATAAMPGLTVPVRFIVGSSDAIVNPSQTAGIYAAGKAPRQLSVIQGGSHCGFLDSNIAFCDSGAITRAAQLDHAHRMTTAFLSLYLRGQQDAWRATWGPELLSAPGVGTQADPGISFGSMETTGGAAPGAAASYALTLTNTGPRAASYTLFYEGGKWPTAVAPAQTPVLQPGESAQVAVTVTVAADAAPGAKDEVLVSARNDSDGGTRGYVRVITTAQ